ncbi:MAG: winged helix-turn-helix domain-containing protein [Acidobacteriota bacterium]
MARECYRLRDLVLDVGAASVTRDDQSLHLPGLSFDLLVTLARRAPDVVPADELIAGVWQGTAVSDETLTQRVALLRRALGDDAKDPRYVRSVRGRGYQIVPEVKADTQTSELEETSDAEPPIGDSRHLAWMAIAALIAATVLGWAYTTQHHTARDGDSKALVTRPPDVVELLERAEVYVNRQQESDNELAVELLEKALTLQPEHPGVLAELSLALSHQVTKFNRSDDVAERAIHLAQQAIELAPEHARAHQAMGLALDSQGRITPALESYRRAHDLDAARTGALASVANLLQVRGRLAEALEANLQVLRSGDKPPYLEVQIGATLALLGFHETAIVWLDRARELRPRNVFAALTRAELELSRGRLDEADRMAAAALERGIRRTELWRVRGDVAWLQGDPIKARKVFDTAAAVDPESRRVDLRRFVLAVAPGPTRDQQIEEVRRRIDQLREARATGDEWPTPAIIEAGLNVAFERWDEALQALDVAIDLGFRDAGLLLHDPTLAGLQGKPAFQQRLERIRRLVEAERRMVLEADWLPPSFFTPQARGSDASR